MSTTITYLGHSCFCITAENGYRIIVDPYEKGSVPGLELPRHLEAEEVYCTHEHHDHNARDLITLSGRDLANPWKESTLTVPHDDANGTKRGMNHMLILEGEGHKIVHFGDLGRLLTMEETAVLAGADCILIPCGGYFTIDAGQAAEIIAQLHPQLTILMHYRTGAKGYDVLADLKDVRQAIPETVSLRQNSITLGTAAGIITLQPK